MDLRLLTRSVQEQLAAHAAVGDEPTRQAAGMLYLALEPALRLALQEAVGQVAAEVSAEIAPGRVELGLIGQELTVRVVPPAGADPSAVPFVAPSAPPAASPAPPHPAVPPRSAAPGAPPAPSAPPVPPLPGEPAEPEEPAEAGTARVTFRPPQPLKTRLERAAAEEQLSVNTYLVRALTAHLDQPQTTAAPAHGAGRTSGWFL
ncbi:hypothetical protein [Brachybacterium sp. sponge]|uniref:hypothetical protein n=1 Tax=Brachybacterium sp. sponge TaxID=1775432 RepID=UPI0007A47788|nr:hypothetical protein [Brachybacterium sp. sponge]